MVGGAERPGRDVALATAIKTAYEQRLSLHAALDAQADSPLLNLQQQSLDAIEHLTHAITEEDVPDAFPHSAAEGAGSEEAQLAEAVATRLRELQGNVSVPSLLKGHEVPQVTRVAHDPRRIVWSTPTSLPQITMTVAQASGLVVPEPIDWKSFGKQIWHHVIISPDTFRERVRTILGDETRLLANAPTMSEGTGLSPRLAGSFLLADQGDIYLTATEAIDPMRRMIVYERVDAARLLNNLDLLVEGPARQLVRDIADIGGVSYDSNAYGPGLKGVWWRWGTQELFTPLTKADYEGWEDEPLWPEEPSQGPPTDGTPAGPMPQSGMGTGIPAVPVIAVPGPGAGADDPALRMSLVEAGGDA